MADSLFNTVSLLLPLDGPAGGTTFRDFSANHHTVTAVGNAAAKAVGKYNGSSAYFDGTGDYLTAPDSATFDFDTSDFTIEFMVNFVAHTTVMTLVSNYLNGTTGWVVQYRGDTSVLRLGYGDTALIDAAWTPTDGVWYHVAVTRSGTSLKFFVDGVQVGTTATNSTNISGSTSVLNIGALNFGAIYQYFNGYMADLRITKGAARYTAAFTPAAGPLRHALDANVVLRLTGEDLFDFSQVGAAITAYGNAAPSATQFKYGTKSLAFDGTGDYLTMPSNTGLAFGTSDFTIEFWVYVTASTAVNFFDMRPSSTVNGIYPTLYFSAGAVYYFVNSVTVITGGAVSTGSWHHLALCRSGTATKMFLDGVQTGSTYTDANSYLTAGVSIGSSSNGLGGSLNGYIDDLTITRRAKYTATFTPPGSALPTETTVDEYASSVVLQLQMDGANASTTFTDSSPTPKTVTAVGNAQISTTQSRFGGSAMYLDGTGDYATVAADASLAMGTGDFTAEAWIYLTALPAECVLFGDILWTGGYQGGWCMAVTSTGILRITYNGTGSAWTNLDSAISLVTANAWHHVATVRQNGVQRIYLNGVQVGSVANTLDYTTGRTFRIGGKMVDGVVGVLMTGYIDDLRITKVVARYV